MENVTSTNVKSRLFVFLFHGGGAIFEYSMN